MQTHSHTPVWDTLCTHHRSHRLSSTHAHLHPQAIAHPTTFTFHLKRNFHQGLSLRVCVSGLCMYVTSRSSRQFTSPPTSPFPHNSAPFQLNFVHISHLNGNALTGGPINKWQLFSACFFCVISATDTRPHYAKQTNKIEIIRYNRCFINKKHT